MKKWAVFLAIISGALAVLVVVLPDLSPTEEASDVVPPSRKTQRIVETVGRNGAAADEIAELLRQFESATSNEGLEHLQGRFSNLSPDDRRRFVELFFGSGSDASLDGSFAVGGDGFLVESPTLRVWLLDQWARLDPLLAAAFARELLNFSSSPDEWAVALRTLAAGDSSVEGRQVLAAKTHELLANLDWVVDPSSGFLQAFDVPVYLEQTEFVPPLTRLLRNTNQMAVAHAAFLALDRLTIASTEKFLSEYLREPEMFAGREEVRAGYFARADVSDSGQRNLVERYLFQGMKSDDELATFVGLFPNANRTISQNLLTKVTPPNGRDLAEHDIKALNVIREWQADERFERLRPALALMERRLADFVRQAKSVKN